MNFGISLITFIGGSLLSAAALAAPPNAAFPDAPEDSVGRDSQASGKSVAPQQQSAPPKAAEALPPDVSSGLEAEADAESDGDADEDTDLEDQDEPLAPAPPRPQ